MKNGRVSIDQGMELLFKLSGQVPWSEYEKEDLQKIIDSVVLSGAHFSEFLRRGGRISTDWIPLESVATQEINLGVCSWKETGPLAQSLLGNYPGLFQWGHSGIVLRPIKPEYWKVRSSVRVSLLKLKEKQAHRDRLLNFFDLLDVHSSTLLEAFTAVRAWKDRGFFDKGIFLLNAQSNHEGYAEDVIIAPSWTDNKSYHEVSVCGDIDDMGYFGNHQYFMVTHR